jgi:hypothetical protein
LKLLVHVAPIIVLWSDVYQYLIAVQRFSERFNVIASTTEP